MSPLESKEDCFDRLPNEILLIIFNKLSNAKSLLQCSSVNKRFNSLVHHTDTIFLSIPRLCDPTKREPKRNNLLKFLVTKFIAKPLHLFRKGIVHKDCRSCNSYYSPNEVLKQFNEVKSMHIEMPCTEDGMLGFEGNHPLLKWKAEFGSELKSCVVLGATSFDRNYNKVVSNDNLCCNNQEDDDDQDVLSRDELKLRIAWTISCLVAASSRHGMLNQVLLQNPSLERVVVTDASKQGKIVLSEYQIFEMRKSAKSILDVSESSFKRIPMPDLCIKLWYVPVLELPVTGHVMKGATLFVIRPVNEFNRKNEHLGDLFGFDGEIDETKAFEEAVAKIVKMKKKYDMTISSF